MSEKYQSRPKCTAADSVVFLCPFEPSEDRAGSLPSLCRFRTGSQTIVGNFERGIGSNDRIARRQWSMADLRIQFNDGAAYDQLMGRWSRLVGDIFLDWLAPAPSLRWIDIG